eukprot:scaffold62251_cov72-Phaeocystis_antarctica.AAC.2
MATDPTMLPQLQPQASSNFPTRRCIPLDCTVRRALSERLALWRERAAAHDPVVHVALRRHVHLAPVVAPLPAAHLARLVARHRARGPRGGGASAEGGEATLDGIVDDGPGARGGEQRHDELLAS